MGHNNHCVRVLFLLCFVFVFNVFGVSVILIVVIVVVVDCGDYDVRGGGL